MKSVQNVVHFFSCINVMNSWFLLKLEQRQWPRHAQKQEVNAENAEHVKQKASSQASGIIVLYSRFKAFIWASSTEHFKRKQSNRINVSNCYPLSQPLPRHVQKQEVNVEAVQIVKLKVSNQISVPFCSAKWISNVYLNISKNNLILKDIEWIFDDYF